MTTNLDQARADVRARLTGRTRRDITRAAIAAKDNRDAYAALHARHGAPFADAAAHATAIYQEHARIWKSLDSHDAAYIPTGA